jgi:regulatory protein
MARQRPPQSPTPPDAQQLRAAALAHLARFAATEASLTRVLLRKIERWQAGSAGAAEAGAAARASVAGIVRELAAAGAVSDESFAQARARSLIRAGRSRRAVRAHLASRGVAQAVAAASLPEDERHELAAALIHARKRRLGPWRKVAASPEEFRRELGSLARAGFPQPIASAALRFTPEEAEALISAIRATL